MKGYSADIESETIDNDAFRRVVYTAEHIQLVLMSLKPNEEIGEEVHNVDQFIRIETGEGLAVIDGEEHELSDGSAVIIPSGTSHNIINVDAEYDLKLYSLYAPPQHQDGLVNATKEAGEEDHLDFDGKTTE